MIDPLSRAQPSRERCPVYGGAVDVPEAPVEPTEHGLVCKGEGWFVVNAREMRWFESEGWGRFSNFGGDTVFEQLGFGITVLGPGQPLSMYHWETDQEDFLVLSGTATLIVEGQERPLRQCAAMSPDGPSLTVP